MLLKLLVFSAFFCLSSCKNNEHEELDVFSKINNQLFCGSAPASEAHFMYLESVGINSIISVDGAKPNLALAEKYGLSYIHIPFGYDRVEVEQQLKLAKAYQNLPKPVFVHCHHGKHRAPVGSAIILRNHSNESPNELVGLIELLGASKHYTGLYRTIQDSKRLDKNDWSKSVLREYESPSDLAEAMAGIDRLWDGVKKNNEFKEREHSRLLLQESFFELARAEKNSILKEQYMEVDKNLRFLRDAMLTKPEESIQLRIRYISGLCKDCHRKNRD